MRGLGCLAPSLGARFRPVPSGTIRVKQEKKLRFLFNGKSLVVGSGIGTPETPKIY